MNENTKFSGDYSANIILKGLDFNLNPVILGWDLILTTQRWVWDLFLLQYIRITVVMRIVTIYLPVATYYLLFFYHYYYLVVLPHVSFYFCTNPRCVVYNIHQFTHYLVGTYILYIKHLYYNLFHDIEYVGTTVYKNLINNIF